MGKLKSANDYAAEAPEEARRKTKWMALWLWTGIISMIVSVVSFYEDSAKIGHIALVLMVFALLMFIMMQIQLTAARRDS
jgi:uncharacterized membrane protein YhaH (DUF805 family)